MRRSLLFVQVKVQTVPGFANGLFDGMPKVVAQEGVGGYGFMFIAVFCLSDH